MPLFDISLAKSGTTSLAAALRMLGLRACHGCPDKHAKDMLSRLLQNNMQFTLLNDFDAVCGALNFAYFQLNAAYPDAKFIWLDRDADEWVKSTLQQLATNDLSGVTAVSELTLGTFARLQNLGCLHTNDAEYLKHRYQTRRTAVLELFKDQPDKLLVMSVTDGWEPLCQFLGRNVPNVPFPKLNVSDA